MPRVIGRSWWRVAALLAALGVAETSAQAVRGWRNAEHTDYVAFATAGRVLNAGSQCIYCLATEAHAQVRLLGHPLDIGLNQFANPPLAAWVLRPVAALPLSSGAGLFLVASLLALVGAALLLSRLLPADRPGRRRLIAACAVTVAPGVGALTYIQWDPLLLLAAAGALVLCRRGDRVAAGALLSVLLLKPQTVWLVVPALLIAGRPRTLAGFCAGAAAWVATSVAIVGVGGVGEWARSAQTYVGESWKTAGVPGLVVQVTGHSSFAAPSGALCAVAAVALMWRFRTRLRSDPALAVATGLALSLLAAPHVFSADLMLLAPLLVVLARHRADLAIAAAAALWAVDLLQEPPAGAAAHALGLAVVGAVIAAALSRPRAPGGVVSGAPRTLVGSA
jgi:hypothetical protein